MRREPSHDLAVGWRNQWRAGALSPEVVSMDPDQDLLDQLDRREAGGSAVTAVVIGGLAALAAIVAYFTLTMELHAGPDIAGSGAALVFIASAILLGVSYYRFR